MYRYIICVLLLVCGFHKPNPTLALERPDFARAILGTGKGNDGKFKDIKKEIIGKSAARLLRNSLHLAHVFPWAAIDNCIERYWNERNQTALNETVEKIFEIDMQAVVPKSWTKKRNSKTNDFIPDSNEIVSHEDYLGPKLVSVNTDLLARALNVCQKFTGSLNEDKCKEFLFNAPANLRFGLGRPNRAISDRLDLMGDTDGKKTTKEVALIGIMEDCYSDIEWWCTRRNQYCVSDDQGEFGIRSSSSYHQFVF